MFHRLPSACEAFPEASITLSGVSKTIGLPGLRIGWLVCKQPKIMERLRELRDYTTICNSAPSEVSAFVACLHSWEGQFSQRRRDLSTGRWYKPVAGRRLGLVKSCHLTGSKAC